MVAFSASSICAVIGVAAGSCTVADETQCTVRAQITAARQRVGTGYSGGSIGFRTKSTTKTGHRALWNICQGVICTINRFVGKSSVSTVFGGITRIVSITKANIAFSQRKHTFGICYCSTSGDDCRLTSQCTPRWRTTIRVELRLDGWCEQNLGN